MQCSCNRDTPPTSKDITILREISKGILPITDSKRERILRPCLHTLFQETKTHHFQITMFGCGIPLTKMTFIGPAPRGGSPYTQYTRMCHLTGMVWRKIALSKGGVRDCEVARPHTKIGEEPPPLGSCILHVLPCTIYLLILIIYLL